MLPNFDHRFNDITSELNALCKLIITTHQKTKDGFLKKDFNALSEIENDLKSVEEIATEIDNQIVKLFAQFSPEASVLRTLISILKITNELVKISNSAKVFAKKVMSIGKEFDYSEVNTVIGQMYDCAIESLQLSLLTYDIKNFEESFMKVQILENKTDDYQQILQESLFAMMFKSGINPKNIFDMLRTVKKIEKIADHSVSIARVRDFAINGGTLKSHY